MPFSYPAPDNILLPAFLQSSKTFPDNPAVPDGIQIPVHNRLHSFVPVPPLYYKGHLMPPHIPSHSAYRTMRKTDGNLRCHASGTTVPVLSFSIPNSLPPPEGVPQYPPPMQTAYNEYLRMEAPILSSYQICKFSFLSYRTSTDCLPYQKQFPVHR